MIQITDQAKEYLESMTEDEGKKYAGDDISNINSHTLMASSDVTVPARIAYQFNLKGPTLAVDTACSSSLVAVQIACNNIWMQELTDEELTINKPKAYKQFMDLYQFMAGGSLVYLLPSEGNFQDQVYVANLGIQLPHIKNENHIILSNFTSDPRKGEELVGEKFCQQMGYKTAVSPYKWEGEADLKYLYGNKYIGGYGIRSNIKTYEWMEEQYNMDIIKVAMVDEYLYHLDCSATI